MSVCLCLCLYLCLYLHIYLCILTYMSSEVREHRHFLKTIIYLQNYCQVAYLSTLPMRSIERARFVSRGRRWSVTYPK